MHNMIYLDNAATTQVYREVVETMLPFFGEVYGNPASSYRFGNRAKDAVEKARRTLAGGIGARPEEIYFTSGGSESDNWALRAAADSRGRSGGHIITTQIEHHAVLNTARYLEERGICVTYLKVDQRGRVNPCDVLGAIRDDTFLISVMTANNEIGTIQPLAEIGRIARKQGILFHTDAVQAFGHIPLDVEAMCIDLLSASSHKLNGPKGVGLLYVRTGAGVGAFIHGGAQERSMRAGTHNVPGIVGFGKAAQLAFGHMNERARWETELRDYLIRRIESEIPDCVLNGDRSERLPNNVHVSIRGVDGESLLVLLDQAGICCSGGSACASGSDQPSHVLLALGQSPGAARGALRLTLSERTTIEEIDYTADRLREIVAKLRQMSGGTYEKLVSEM